MVVVLTVVFSAGQKWEGGSSKGSLTYHLLRERKRHTARCVATTRCAALSPRGWGCYLPWIGGGGAPTLNLGYSLRQLKGTPPPAPVGRKVGTLPPPPHFVLNKVKTLPPVVLRTRVAKMINISHYLTHSGIIPCATIAGISSASPWYLRFSQSGRSTAIHRKIDATML